MKMTEASPGIDTFLREVWSQAVFDRIYVPFDSFKRLLTQVEQHRPSNGSSGTRKLRRKHGRKAGRR